MSGEKEPHLIFREAVQLATSKVGGNMKAFLMLYNYEDPSRGSQVTWSVGGDHKIREMLALEAATNLVERIQLAHGGDLAAALAVLNGEVAKRLNNRKQRGGV